MDVPRALGALDSLASQARVKRVVETSMANMSTDRAFMAQYADWVNVGDPGAPAFLNTWEAYANDGSLLWPDPRQPPGFYRDRWGFVHLRGAVQILSGSTDAPVFTLPADLWPAWTEKQWMTKLDRSSPPLTDRVGVNILPDGTIEPTFVSGTPFYLGLTGIRFRAANAGNPPIT